MSEADHITDTKHLLAGLAFSSGGETARPRGMYASPKRSGLISALVHVAVFALLLVAGKVVKTIPTLVDHGSIVLPSDLVKYQVTATEDGRGGGGQNDRSPAQRGHLLKITTRPFVPPAAHVANTQPVLSLEMAILGDPSIVVPAINLPVVGDPNSVLGTFSGGPGGPTGIGDRGNGGIGKERPRLRRRRNPGRWRSARRFSRQCDAAAPDYENRA